LDSHLFSADHRGTLRRHGSLNIWRLMMNSQFYAQGPASLPLAFGEAQRLRGLVGELTVASGRVWLTRDGDLDDYVLGAGDHFMLAADDVVVVEAWQRDESTTLAWRPRRQALPRPDLPREVVELGERAFA